MKNTVQRSDKMKVSEEDQLKKILEKLGPQSEKTVNDFNEKTRNYIKQLQQNLEKKQTIDDMFTNTDPQLVEIIKKMLTFSPVDRISAEECIQSPYFDEFRDFQ